MSNIHTPQSFLILYLVILNGYGLVITWVDKQKAVKRRYRIPERVFFIIGFLGGSAGVYSGMKLFHHKTLHNKFKYGIPALLLVNIICIVYLFIIL